MIKRLILAITMLAACSYATTPDDATGVDLSYSFEQGLGDWEIAATDLMVGGSQIPWHIVPSTAVAFDGAESLEFYMANFTDAAKIWIVHPYSLRPNTDYDVHLSYELGTADWGNANLFSLITGGFARAPVNASDLEPAFKRSATGNGAPSDAGYRWIHKDMESTLRTGADGKAYIVIGIWGTFEVTRTYYIDALRVHIDPL